MNKKLSRIAAIALSAAMVTSAFAMSTSSAFAATAASITPDSITYAAAYDKTAGKANLLDTTTVFAGATATVKADKDSKNVPVKTFDSYKITSGTNVAEINADGKIHVKSAGTFTIQGYKGNIDATELETVKHSHVESYTADNVTVTATVKVYDTTTALVLPTTATTTNGSVPSNAKTVGINEAPAFKVYTVSQVSDTADATAAFSDTNSANYTISSSNKYIKIDAAGQVTKQAANDVHTGYSTITAKLTAAPNTAAQAASLTVANHYTVEAPSEAVDVTSNYGEETKTTLGTEKYDVTGMDVVVNSGSILTVAKDGASLGAVTGAGSVVVNGGTVKSITTTATVGTVVDVTSDVNVGNTVVGDITAAGAVKVTGAAAKNTDNTYSSVKVGNISAPSVELITSADEENKTAYGLATVGNVTTTGAVKVTTSKAVKTLTAGTFTGTQGNYADCPYTATFELTAGKFTTGDLKYVGEVKVAANAELTAGAIATGTFGDDTAYGSCKKLSKSTLDVLGKLTASSIAVAKAPASADNNGGVLTVPAASLTIADNSIASGANSGLTLYVKNAAKGTVLYTSNKAASSLFTIPGVTTTESTNTGKNIYTYTAQTVEFLGFDLNQTEVDLGKGASTTLTATTIPQMALPTGVTVAWTADTDTVKLTPSADTLSCTVTENGYTPENVNGGNTVKVTANLMKDGAAYAPFNSDKATGVCTVNLTAETAPVLTTTVTDLDGKITTVTPETVIKMTQSTYNTVDFSADKAGISEAALAFHTGNDKVAQTGTYTKWNGTAGKYNVYANGAVGSKVGVFANGVKVFQIEIVDRPFKCDTTLDLDGVKGKALTVGQKYSFKITPADGTKIDTFTFLTANDSAVASWGFVKNADGTVTATIKALKATDKIGVYAKINGVTYKVFAAAVK